MKKSIVISAMAVLLGAVSCTQPEKVNKTQAYLGLKNGGEWKWVTKNNGNEQYEYQGGAFHPVTELWLDEKHTDHSFDIQFEGPGWESDKIAYRLYLDWRNATDIFGKKTDTTVLHAVGLDGFDSYHELSDWGTDVLKVGSSLGVGALGFWDGEKATRVEKTDSIYCAVNSGELASNVVVDYYGWEIDSTKTDLHTTLEIEAGSYLTKYTIEMSNPLQNLATGIVKHGVQVELVEDIKPGWSCLLTFGEQSLQKDMLGMCVFFKNDEKLEITSDAYSEVVVLKPTGNTLTYYFGAAWQQDASGVKTIDEFKALLKDQTAFIK